MTWAGQRVTNSKRRRRRLAPPCFRTSRPCQACSSGGGLRSGLSRSVVTVHGLMRGFARDLGMAPAMGLDGTGASPRVGSQAIVLAKLLELES